MSMIKGMQQYVSWPVEWPLKSRYMELCLFIGHFYTDGHVVKHRGSSVLDTGTSGAVD